MLLHLIPEPPINLNFNLAIVVFRRYTYELSVVLINIYLSIYLYIYLYFLILSIQRLLLRTTSVSNRFCYPSLRYSVSVFTQIIAFAFGIPSNIYSFYWYTRNSIILYNTLENILLIFISYYPYSLYNYHMILSTY